MKNTKIGISCYEEKNAHHVAPITIEYRINPTFKKAFVSKNDI